ncbi:RND family transporter [Mycobacteroides abscessus]|nr:RND family transporter [Mycobacteroides abscessus]MDM2427134.1 RND family transporter [Mycobacteroides abscessus]MDM2432199.1 RND family transporter [Mycobacteroides abscessus]MDM2436716.1 RND family transporter [Mycobacteroides abscessus]MDM2438674.1 RND family transporter [Mycobacteroides abscessus]
MWIWLASFCSRYAILIVGGWVAIAAALNLLVPQLEPVAHDHARSFFPTNAPIAQTVKHMGNVFHDGDTDNLDYLVLESERPLGDSERRYYDHVITALRSDTKHVQSVQDFWGDPLTKQVGLSADGKAVFAMLRLADDVGSGPGAAAVEAARAIVAKNPPPAGVQAYVTGPGTTITDEFDAIEHQMLLIMGATTVVIALLLLAVYRSIVTTWVPLTAVGLALAVARPTIAYLGGHGAFEISLFSATMMSAVLLGITTDYGIFLLGRYHEERRQDVAHQQALGIAYRQVGPVILASGLTIAAGLSCLSLANINTLRTAGIPCSVGVLVGIVASLTLLPALIGLFGRRGWAQPRAVAKRSPRRWRQVGAAVARWPGPVLVAAILVLIVCALPLLGLRPGFQEARAVPDSAQSNLGYRALDRHFPPNAVMPEIIVIETDHDMRNPQGLIALERVARGIMAVPGVRMVQSASRPAGTVPNQARVSNQAGQIADRLSGGVDTLSQRLAVLDQFQSALGGFSASVAQLQAGLDGSVGGLKQLTGGADDMQAGLAELRGHANTVSSDLDPLREMVNANPNCVNDGLCSAVMKVVGPVDGMVAATETLAKSATVLGTSTGAMTKSVAGTAGAAESMRAGLSQLNALSTQLSQATSSIRPMFAELTDYLREASRDFADTGEGGFYLPQRAWQDPDFARAAKIFFSGDGKAARFYVFEDGEVFGSEGADRAPHIANAVHEATKEGSLVHHTISHAGYGVGTGEMREFVAQDRKLVVVVSVTMIFLIMLVMLRSPVAATVVIGTVVLSYLSAVGITTLIWQDLVGKEMHWSVPAIALVALVSVGADYNLLMCLRVREEVEMFRGKRLGLRTGMIRAFAGTGSVVTVAGIVFGVTMFAMLVSDVLAIAEVGTAIGVGLVIDTLIVRTFVVPGLMGVLGPWFWWPFRLLPRKRRTSLGGQRGNQPSYS